jgi:hypothetical protein
MTRCTQTLLRVTRKPPLCPTCCVGRPSLLTSPRARALCLSFTGRSSERTKRCDRRPRGQCPRGQCPTRTHRAMAAADTQAAAADAAATADTAAAAAAAAAATAGNPTLPPPSRPQPMMGQRRC